MQFFMLLQMTLAGCGQVRRKKKKKVAIDGKTPGLCQHRKFKPDRNPASGKAPRDGQPFIPTVPRKNLPLSLQKFHLLFLWILPNMYSREKEQSQAGKCQVSSQIHGMEIRGDVRVEGDLVQR